MEGRLRPPRRTLLALVLAIVCTGLVGYAISRPARPPAQVQPTPRPSITPLATPSPPSAQSAADGFAVADDPAAGQVVVFGGSMGAGNDTWIWSGNRWMLAAPVNQPPAIGYGTAAYNPQLRMVMLAGGEPYGASSNNGTWGWDGVTWHELDADVDHPPIGGGTMAWDPALQEMVMVTAASTTDESAQTWVWTVNHWSARGGHASFQVDDFLVGYDSAQGALLAFTCCAMLPDGASAGSGTQIWRWDGSVWRQLATTMNAPAATLFGLSWDSSSRSLLLCGQDTDASETNGSLEAAFTWRLVGREWTAVSAGAAPDVLEGFLIDTANGLRLIGSTPFAGSSTPFHIWAWVGAGWKPLG
jgi:hypothetical protein